MRIHCIRHEPFEGLSSIASWVSENSHTLSYTHVYLHQRFPEELTFDLLIIMGGTASVYEPHKHHWLLSEKKFIQKAIAANKKVLGICLGAQIIADLLGGKVFPAEVKEIGWFPVYFNKADLPDYPFLPERLQVFHWHGDTFDLPPGALRFGSSDLTKNQGFLVGRNILALQFHLELIHTDIKKLIKACGAQLTETGKYIQSADEMLNRAADFDLCNMLMFKVLNQFMADLT